MATRRTRVAQATQDSPASEVSAPAVSTTGAVRRRKGLEHVAIPAELNAVLDAIRKKHGNNTVLNGSQITQPYRIPTGIFLFDYATMGGIPHNRVTMFDGAKHSGKTTGSLRCIKGAQLSLPDQKAALIDVEGTYDSTWGRKIGVDNEQLVVVQPDTGEQAVDIAVGLAHAKETSLIVVDSLAALLPIKEQEASAEDSLVGQQSRMITSMLRKLTGAMISERKRGHFVSILLINQQRAKIGGYNPNGLELVVNPGGKAVGFFTSLEVRWKNKEVLKGAGGGPDELAWNEHSFSIQKNKMNGGIRTGDFRMLRRPDPELGLEEAAVDDAETLLAFAKRFGMVDGGGRAGIDITIGDFSEHFNKTDDAVYYLNTNPDIYNALRCSVIATHAQNSGMAPAFVDYLLGN
jgi:recombination protein RecA